MKVLRILRRRKIKLSFVFLLLLVFIFNTYAWMTREKENLAGNLALNVSSWDVAFIIDDEEIKTEEYTFEIEEFYPGITQTDTTTDPITNTKIEKTIEVWNIGEANSYLKYEITEIYLYGMQILNKQVDGQETTIPETIDEETTVDGQTTANLFGNQDATIFDEENTNYQVLLGKTSEGETYSSFSIRYPTPFTITYTYGLTHISGSGTNNEVGSRSEMTITLKWDNDELNNEEDTRLGNLVYEFENAKDADGNLLHQGEPALRIVARVTATKDSATSNTYVDN